MMENHTEFFGDEDEFEVTLEISPDETQGWCSCRKTGTSASLAALDATGVLTGKDLEKVVHTVIIAEIMAWAEEKGY